MTRYAVVVMVDSTTGGQEILNEIVSALEFEGRSNVRSLVVLDEDGHELANHPVQSVPSKRKQQCEDR